MRRLRVVAGAGLIVGLLTAVAFAPAATSATAPAVRHEVIAVYLGARGTDEQSGMVQAVKDMRDLLTKQAVSTNRRFILRGVSLEPTVEEGLQDLSLFGKFDEVSVGGNWTNSAVVRYIGTRFDSAQASGIPQVVLLERDVTEGGPSSLTVSPEREIARYVGTRDIDTWVRRGAPLP